MIQYTVYSTTTGLPIRTGSAMTEASARLQGTAPGTRVTLVGSDPATQIIDVHAIGTDPGTLPRVPMQVGGTATAVDTASIKADGIGSLTISPIPQDATFLVATPNGVGIDADPTGTVSDGSLTITTTVAGNYTATIKSGTFLDYVVNFNAS